MGIEAILLSVKLIIVFEHMLPNKLHALMEQLKDK
jgi:hypothetical protein